jgi:uncharacterized protein (DUF58 family)
VSLLTPSVIAAIDDLELAARVIVEGLRVGGNRSPFHGYGAEFQQYRSYRPGDDLKYLDWKVYARSDRLFTRQFRETTNLSMMLVIDTSASMGYPVSGVSKLRYAVILAASLAYLVVQQGNAVGLFTRQDGEMVYLPPRSSRAHLRALLAQLDALRASGEWSGPATIQRGAELLRRRGLMLVLSDFYDDEAAVQAELRQVVQRGHDVAMLQVLSPGEREWQRDGQWNLEDLETGASRVVNAAAVRASYNEAVAAFLDRTRASAAGSGIDYAYMQTDLPPERALREYLIARTR